MCVSGGLKGFYALARHTLFQLNCLECFWRRLALACFDCTETLACMMQLWWLHFLDTSCKRLLGETPRASLFMRFVCFLENRDKPGFDNIGLGIKKTTPLVMEGWLERPLPRNIGVNTITNIRSSDELAWEQDLRLPCQHSRFSWSRSCKIYICDCARNWQ